MPLIRNNFRSTLFLSALTLTLAACASDRKEPAPVTYRTVSPTPNARPAQPSKVAPTEAPAPIPSGQADGRGVVHYDGYDTIRARANDTVESMAARVGVTGSELAAYNGLSTQYIPREGDELVLPPNAGGYAAGGTMVASVPEYQPSAPERLTEGEEHAAEQPRQVSGDQAWSADLARAAINDTAQPEAVSSTPVPPPAAPAPRAEAPAPAPERAAAAPAPAAAGPSNFIRPVDASVSRPFSRSPGPERNDGVDFATKAGDPVRAAAGGTVALISESLGGLGTIVLIRHDDEYLTVYGRVEGVTVAKGDQVKRGQVIAKVADLEAPQSPSLHYEVRRGAESIDPTPYL